MSSEIDRLAQKLRVNYLAPPARMIAAFWSWWSTELVATLPDHLRERVARRNQRLFVTLEGADLVLSEGGNTATQEIGRHPFSSSAKANFELPEPLREVVLCLPREKVLASSMTFPVAAEENLRGVLGFEMDRQTPFTLDQVYFDYCITSRSSAERSITLDLVVSPKQAVDEIMDGVKRAGIDPDVITVPTPDSAGLMPVNLLPKAERRSRRLFTHRLNTALGAICGLLLLAALSLPLILKQQEIGRLEPQLAAAVAAASDGIELRREVEQLAAGSVFLVEKKRTTVLALQVVDEVTRILPDNTWLDRLDINESEIQIQGQSLSAAALIQLLESSSMFSNVRFRSSVVQVPRTAMERFHISLELESGEST